ncbi:hypothetical protein KBA41_07315 [Candidatus Ozemobacteraceae bacterium]|nr:hypothetical protein [Candidatus Ozemobacteraceae bacterium]
MSMLEFVSGATCCEICGLSLKTARFSMKIDGRRVTVCANCKSFIKAETDVQPVPSDAGEASPAGAEPAQPSGEFLKLGLVAGLALWLALTILI